MVLSSQLLSFLALAAASAVLPFDTIQVHAFTPAFYPPNVQTSHVTTQPQPGYFRPLNAIDDDDDDDDLMMGDASDIDSPSAEDYIVNVGDLEAEGSDADGVAGSEDDGQPPAWAESARRIQELRMEHRRHDKDTGSPEYQVAGMTERIRYLTGHLQAHPTDYSTRRGLVALVNKRRRLLNYLSREDAERYRSLISSLGIRHKAPGRVPDRAEKYGRFPPQKVAKKHLVN